MNRTIKFRAWDKTNNQWNSYGDRLYINAQDGSLLDVASQYDTGGISEDLQLMQFTGLLDKNGKEIYEGDILKGYFNPDDVEDYIYNSLTAEEKESGTRLFTVEDIFYPYTNPLPDDLEVIGNIYENPELIQE